MTGISTSAVDCREATVIAAASVVGRFRKHRVQPTSSRAFLSFFRAVERSGQVFHWSFPPSTGSLAPNIVDTEVTHYSSRSLGPSFGGGTDVRLHPYVIVRTEA